ncbi:AUR protein kinase [Saprolegnia diclina VS20]|uniref:AUR protein kinase n=1 Tax=Saprolegnia diclina (strain VS20) TaxID=1156394 RepID=T0QQP7_SAPDV|nr:AUR protein kinase [Saprolegnia diclina VS20]EQC40434.1 AUR protein kinase [Saprolegnia diclina VS20]|eukprot:XP_008606133.1 AUR protein kinase [Saprolegnia diclina VS20]
MSTTTDAIPTALMLASAPHGLAPTRKLGKGGSADVYLAQHMASGRHFAVKVVAKSDDQVPRRAEALWREIDIQLALVHDRIVRLYTVFEDATNVYLVLEYLPGGAVFDVLDQQAPWREDQAARCIHDVACGLAYMHAYGCAHRDIKAENILIDCDGRYKIADVGVSVYTWKCQQQLRAVGTTDYMSPEVAAGQPHDATTDLWSLGILTYELLVGYPPFSLGSNLTEDQMKKRIQDEHVKRPPHISDSAWDLIAKLLQQEKCDRLPAALVARHDWIETHCGTDD